MDIERKESWEQEFEAIYGTAPLFEAGDRYQAAKIAKIYFRAGWMAAIRKSIAVLEGRDDG